MSAIVSIDPGGNTGVVWIDRFCHENELAVKIRSAEMRGGFGEFLSKYGEDGELFAAEQVVTYLGGIQAKHGISVVVYEKFILRRFDMDSDLLSPVRLWTMIRTLMYDRYEVEPTYIGQVSDAMSSVTDERLRSLGLWLRGSKDARAALKHLVHYLRKQRLAAS